MSGPFDTRETSFNDQTGQSPKQSKRGHKYIMVLVNIESNVIMVEPMKSRKDAYDVLVKQLQTANIHTWKNILYLTTKYPNTCVCVLTSG